MYESVPHWPAKASRLLAERHGLDPKVAKLLDALMQAASSHRTVEGVARRIYISRRNLVRIHARHGLPVPGACIALAFCLASIERGISTRSSASETSRVQGFTSHFGLSWYLHHWTGLRPSVLLANPETAFDRILDAWCERHLPNAA